MQTHRIIDALNDDEIDVGLLATPLSHVKMHEYPLYFEPFYLLCQNQHPLAAQKRIKYHSLKYDDLWLLEEGHCLRNQILELCSRRKPGSGAMPNVELEGGSLETVMSLVDQGRGFTLVPELLVLGLSVAKKLRCKKFVDPVPSREISLVSRRTQFKGTLLNLLESAIIKSLPDSLPRSPNKKISVIPVVP